MSVQPESARVHRSLAESGGVWRIVHRTLPDSGRTMWGSEKYCAVGVIRRCIKKCLTLGHFIYALMSPTAENSTSVVELQSMWMDRKTL